MNQDTEDLAYAWSFVRTPFILIRTERLALALILVLIGCFHYQPLARTVGITDGWPLWKGILWALITYLGRIQ